MRSTIILCMCFFSSLSYSQAVTGEGELSFQYEKADKELNLIYNKLKDEIGSIDKRALIDAQKSWLIFRDLNCKFKSQEDSEGGVISNKLKIDCLIQSTVERTKELKNLIGGF